MPIVTREHQAWLDRQIITLWGEGVRDRKVIRRRLCRRKGTCHPSLNNVICRVIKLRQSGVIQGELG